MIHATTSMAIARALTWPLEPTEIGRSRELAAVAVSGALAASVLAAPSGATEIAQRLDLRGVVDGTTVRPGVEFEAGGFRPLAAEPTLMSRILDLAGLSARQWAEVLGVSHTTIANWRAGDPSDLAKLKGVLAALEHAATFHGDLDTWLIALVPGLQVRPLDLLAEGRVRAFRGAVRARVGAEPAIARDELAELVKQDPAWPVREVVSVDGERA